MNVNKKKIAVFVNDLSFGGITTYVVNFINAIAENTSHDVTLIFLSASTSKKELLNKQIRFKQIKRITHKSLRFIVYAIFHGYLKDIFTIIFRNKNSVSPISSIQRIGYALSKLYTIDKDHYDVVISTAEFFSNYFVINCLCSKKKIGMIHPDLSALSYDSKLTKFELESLNRIIVVSDSCAKSLSNLFPDFKEKIIVIENILPLDELRQLSSQYPVVKQEEKINIVTVCRLDNSSKRVDRIIRLVKFLKDKNVPFVWNIVGDGDDATVLKKMALDFGVSDSLFFVGFKDNPYPYVLNSDIFVLLSQYEGKPIAVDEALALGIPCVVTNYSSAKNQVGALFGAVIDNDDNLINEQFYSFLTMENINKWKNNLKSRPFNNKEIIDKLTKMIND